MASSSYHHGRLREALVEEAIAAARESGPSGLGLRELARRVGVSHNAAYRHFAHREDLVGEVAAHAMDRLVAAMRARLDELDGPDAQDGLDPVVRARLRLAAVGRAYVEFALAEPGLFRVAFTADPRGAVAGAMLTEGPYLVLCQVLDEMVEVGFLAPPARVGADVTCWSLVHGFSVLNLDGPLAGATPAERATALEQLLLAVDRSYAASTGRRDTLPAQALRLSP